MGRECRLSNLKLMLTSRIRRILACGRTSKVMELLAPGNFAVHVLFVLF